MVVTKSKRPKLTIIRLSNLKQMEKISKGLYYYLDFESNEITYFDTRTKFVEKHFNGWKEFDAFLAKEFK